MQKILRLLSVAIIIMISIQADDKNLVIYFKDGKTVSYPLKDIKQVVFEKKRFIKKSASKPGLIMHYPFQNNCNNAVGHFHGVANNVTLTTDRFEQSKSAYYFDGNGYIQTRNVNMELSDFSLSLWAYTDHSPDWYRVLIAIHSGGSGVNKGDKNISLYFNKDGKVDGVYTTHDGQETHKNVTAQMPLKRWVHIVFLRKKQVQQLYIDGKRISVLKDSLQGFKIHNGLLHIGAPNYWGRGWHSNGRSHAKWRGKLDDIRLYNRALSNKEIIELFQKP